MNAVDPSELVKRFDIELLQKALERGVIFIDPEGFTRLGREFEDAIFSDLESLYDD